MEIPLPRGSYEGRSKNINTQKLINWFSQVNPIEGAKSEIVLTGTPGLTSRVTLAADAEVRGAIVMGSALYVAAAGKLYSVDTDWAATELGDLDTTTGPVTMDEDGDYVMLTDGTSGYTYRLSTTTFAKITDGDFIGAGSTTFLDGYFITFEPDSQKMQISSANNPTAWNASEISYASGKSDNLVRVIATKANKWCFGKASTEIWYNSGATDYPFERVPAAVLDIGLASVAGVCRISFARYNEDATDALCFLSDKRDIRVAYAVQTQMISTPAVNKVLAELTSIDDVILYSYTQEGYTHVVVCCPTDDKTLVWNSTSGHWYDWQSWKIVYGSDYADDTEFDHRHRSNCYAYFNGFHVVGDYLNGKLYTMETGTYKDDTYAIRRVATFPTISEHDSRKHLVHRNFMVEMETGVGLDGDTQGDDPMLMMRMSDNHGWTWGPEAWRSMGKMGERDLKICRWSKLGKSRDRTYQLILSDPVKPILIRAYGDIMEALH
jgi:hypothetical protein